MGFCVQDIFVMNAKKNKKIYISVYSAQSVYIKNVWQKRTRY